MLVQFTNTRPADLQSLSIAVLVSRLPRDERERERKSEREREGEGEGEGEERPVRRLHQLVILATRRRGRDGEGEKVERERGGGGWVKER